jgi:protein O-mannosyl-transferase
MARRDDAWQRRSRAHTAIPPTLPPHPSTRHHWLAMTMILLAGALAYANSLRGPFVLDDQASIVNNAHLRHLWPPLGALTAERDSPLAGRPIASLSLALNYALGGLDVRGYHLANIALHLCVGLLLFGIVRGTLDLPKLRGGPADGGGSTSIALISALIWVVHPLNSEAVNYVTQRTELLMGLFYGLTLFSSVRAHSSTRPDRWFRLAVVSCALGMGCKESMVTCPVLVALFDRAFVYDSYGEMWRSRWRWYAGLGATWAVLALLLWSGPRTHSAGFSTGVSPWTYLLNQCVIVTQYVRLALWPKDLVFIYGIPRTVVLSDVVPLAALVVSLAVAAALVWWRRPMVGFLGLWVFFTLAPTSSVVPIATEVGAERRMYLPLAGLIVLAVLAFRTLVGRAAVHVPGSWRESPFWSVAGWALVATVSIALMKTTVDRNREYQSGLTLAQTALARWPTGPAHHTVAVELILGGRTEEAWPHLQAAILETPRAHYTMGVALMDNQRWAEAVEHLQAFVRAEPSLEQVVSARSLMGQAWLRLGRPDAAVEQFQLALQMSPSALDAHVGLGDGLSQQGHFDDAIGHYRTYLAARPDDVMVLTNLGRALATVGREAEGVDAFRRVLTLDPQNSQATRNLSLLLFNRGDYTEAATYARRVVRERPADAVGHDLLGMALAELSKWDESITELREARRLDPTNTDFQDHLARTLQLRASSMRGSTASN